MAFESRLIKEMILKLNDEMKRHTHQKIDSQIESLKDDCLKLHSENGVLRNENADISKLIQNLSNNNKAKKINRMESDVHDFKDGLTKINYKIEQKLSSSQLQNSVNSQKLKIFESICDSLNINIKNRIRESKIKQGEVSE